MADSARITRRAIVRAFPSIAATTALPAVAIAAPVGETPVAKAHRLATELAEALDHVDGGAQFARVSPKSDRWNRTVFGNIEAFEAAYFTVRQELKDKIAAHRAAFQRLETACPATDQVKAAREGKAISEVAEAEYSRANADEIAALTAVCSMPCINMAEQITRARYLAAHYERNDFTDSDMTAFVRSSAGEPA